MTTTKKAPAYTTEITASMVEKYQAGTSLEDLAKEFGKTVPMIRSKLVNEKVYVAKAKTSTATGSAPVRKAALVLQAETALGLEKGALESFEKGSKAQLEILLKALTSDEADES